MPLNLIGQTFGRLRVISRASPARTNRVSGLWHLAGSITTMPLNLIGQTFGLAAAHERGLIHRDIKPGNLWLEGPTRRVRILDFGLARPSDPPADETPITHAGKILGTPAYMAPEQAAGNPIDGRADLFSLGCVMYQMTTGEMPFKASNLMGILTALATHQPPAPWSLNKDVPAVLSNLVVNLLAKDPRGRPSSARALLTNLNAMAQRMNEPVTLPKSATGEAHARNREDDPPSGGAKDPAGPVSKRGASKSALMADDEDDDPVEDATSWRVLDEDPWPRNAVGVVIALILAAIAGVIYGVLWR
jgi:serine/threonine protein kinase